MRTVLEGSVRQAGERIRITAQLIDVASGYHLWSEKFDREMQDVFAVQDEIARAIADTLKVRLPARRATRRSSRRRPANVEAYDHYLKGRYFWSRRQTPRRSRSSRRRSPATPTTRRRTRVSRTPTPSGGSTAGSRRGRRTPRARAAAERAPSSRPTPPACTSRSASSSTTTAGTSERRGERSSAWPSSAIRERSEGYFWLDAVPRGRAVRRGARIGRLGSRPSRTPPTRGPRWLGLRGRGDSRRPSRNSRRRSPSTASGVFPLWSLGVAQQQSGRPRGCGRDPRARDRGDRGEHSCTRWRSSSMRSPPPGGPGSTARLRSSRSGAAAATCRPSTLPRAERPRRPGGSARRRSNAPTTSATPFSGTGSTCSPFDALRGRAALARHRAAAPADGAARGLEGRLDGARPRRGPERVCRSAARNAAVSSRVPIETRSQFGSDGNLRPTRIFFAAELADERRDVAADVDHHEVRLRRDVAAGRPCRARRTATAACRSAACARAGRGPGPRDWRARSRAPPR